MIRVAKLISAALFLLFISGILNSGYAQTPAARQTAQSILTTMDKNGDGKISKDEAHDDVKPYFDSLDANGDGSIDLKEAKTIADYANKAQGDQAKPVEKVTAKSMVASMDRNGDGKISKGEAPAQLAEYFDAIDANSDGAIDVEEAKVMADYANNQQSETQSKTMEFDPSEEATAEKLMAALDKNADGKISKEEAMGPIKDYFDSIDSNQDRSVDLKEARAGLEYSKQFGNTVTMGQIKNGTKSVAKNNPASDLDPEKAVAAMDKNGDGKISKDEAPEDLVLFFSNYDTNADGSIDKKESEAIVTYLKQLSPDSKKTAKQTPAEKVTAKSIMKGLDQNGDGKITKEEAPQQLKDAFGYVDTNKDGFIDLEEAQAMADYQNNQK